MSVIKKIKWFIAVLAVFLLVLATNLIDRENFAKVEESVESIYNERLLAKELLMDVSMRFHKKELAYITNDSIYLKSENDRINAEISDLLVLFDRTKATEKEVVILNDLRENHASLILLESSLLIQDTLYSANCVQIFSAINANIVELANEQVKEGRIQKFNARTAVDSINLFSKIEIYMLIILAILLQGIILYSPRKEVQEDSSE